jgi:predicted dehydrogenase
MSGTADRIGLVGYGYFGKKLAATLAEIHKTNPGVKLAAVADKDKDQQLKALAANPRIKVYDDIDSMIAGAELTAVIIATPAPLHYQLAHTALSAGLDVIVEKPMTLNVEEATSLEALAAAKKLTLMVDHTMCFDPGVGSMKTAYQNYIASRAHQSVTFTSLRINNCKDKMYSYDCNILWDLLVHDVAVIDYLNSGKSKLASVFSEGTESSVTLSLLYKNGNAANLTASWEGYSKKRHFTISGRNFFYQHDPEDPMWETEKTPLYKMLTNFIERRNGVPSTTGCKQGLRVVEILAAADKSLKTGVRVYGNS